MVSPGESATIASLSVVAESKRISTLPPGKSVACAVTRPVLSKSGTLHHVTVKALAAELTKIPPPFAGSRSAKKSAARGGPLKTRPSERSVLASSPRVKLRLPSELTNTELRAAP